MKQEELVRFARRSRPLPDAVRERSRARVERIAAIPAAAGVLFWMKGLAYAAGAFAAIGVVVLVNGAHHSPAPPVPTAPASVTVPSVRERPAPVITGATNVPAPVENQETTRASQARTERMIVVPKQQDETADAGATDSLAAEAAMLEKARGLLASDPSAALTTLDAHQAAFPSGHMSMERELIAIDALSRLHRDADARARGEAFLARAPNGLYADRARELLSRLPPK
jgi:hypothetical protein